MNYSAVAFSLASIASLQTTAIRSASRRLRLHTITSFGGESLQSHRSCLDPRHPSPYRSEQLHRLYSRTPLRQVDSMEADATYWNRENSKPTNAHEGEVVQEARILALSDPDDAYNESLYFGPLPEGSRLLAVGASLVDFDKEFIVKQNPNVIFVSHPNARDPLMELLQKFPSVKWVHTRSAGIDAIASEGEFEIFCS